MKRELITNKELIQRNENYTPFIVIDGQKVKVYWWTELQCNFYYTKNGKPVAQTIMS